MSRKNWELLLTNETREEVKKYIKDKDWQQFRKNLKFISLGERYKLLMRYKMMSVKNKRAADVRVSNYVKALKRAGMV